MSLPDREIVLAHPDLRERLTTPPLGYASAEQWNGYIPPELCNGEHNSSPRRAALVDIVAEAHRRAATWRAA
jgi:hypothetical protein